MTAMAIAFFVASAGFVVMGFTSGEGAWLLMALVVSLVALTLGAIADAARIRRELYARRGL